MGVQGLEKFQNLTALDHNANCKPDLVWDLTNIPWPFEDNTFDEVHAYCVMEHYRSQGDYKGFFADFEEIWRVLKAGGFFFCKVPRQDSPWAFGDPSHTRIIAPHNLIFLDREAQRVNIELGLPASDFRRDWKGDYLVKDVHFDEGHMFFILQAVKPARI